MFALRIAPLPGARDLLAAGWATRCISAVDPGTDVSPRAPRHLLLEFEDIGQGSRRTAAVPPSARHVSAVLDFTADLGPDDRLLVHCHGAYGRSPAIAIGVLVQHGADVPDAWAQVRRQRPQCAPNDILLGLFDTALRQRGRLGGYRPPDHAGPRPPGGILLPAGSGQPSGRRRK
jgi:predicted protein tyrosine phosphatase